MATVVATGKAPERRRLKLPERLPQLGGWFLRAYQAVWIIAAILAIGTSTFFAYRTELRDQAVNLALYDAGLMPTFVVADGTHVAPFSGEAHSAGVRNDDLVVRINGRPAPSWFDIPRLLRGPDGTRVTLALSGPHGQLREVTLTIERSYLRDAYAGTGIDWTVRRWLEFSIRLTGVLLSIAASAMLFFRRPNDPVAAMLSLGLLLGPVDAAQLPGTAFPGVDVAVRSFGFALLLSGVLFFPDGRLTPRWWPIAESLILVGTCGVIAGFWSVAVMAVTPLIMLLAFAVSVAAVVWRYRYSAAGDTRQQIKFAMLGFVGCVIFLALNAVLNQAVIHGASEGIRAWTILLRSLTDFAAGACFTFGLLVSLLRFRLYDAETAIGRSAAYGVLTVGFVALFTGAEKLAEVVGETYFAHSIGIAAGAAGAAVAAAVVVPLHNRVHGWAERRFQKALIRLRDGLPECIADLRESASVDDLVRAVMSRVEAGVRSTREAVVLRARRKWTIAGAHNISAKTVRDWTGGWSPTTGEATLDCRRADALFPMRVRLAIDTADEPETIGWLLLGPRPDGSFFGKDEREALAAIAAPVARAIHIAQLREQREAQAEARLGRLEAMIGKLAGQHGSGGVTSAAPAQL